MLSKWLAVVLIWTHQAFSQEEDSQCICVPYYLCTENNTINTNGIGVIDIRIKPEECTNYLHTCCKAKDVTEKPKIRAPPRPAKYKCGQRNPDGFGFRIMGDEDNEAQFGEFPWMVAVFRAQNNEKPVYVCGGSLLHPWVVLTAAHCVSGAANAYKIRAGEWDTQTREELYKHQDRDVRSIVSHPQYNSQNLANDVALLFLKDPLNVTNHISTACLPPQNFIASGDGCFVTGWGKENFEKEGQYQSILKKIELPVVDRLDCQNAFRGTRLGGHFNLDRSFMCAGGEEGKDACTGDGGGPLVCPVYGDNEDRFYQVGIVAWGIGCGTRGVPGAYVDVGRYRTWIDKQFNRKSLPKDTYEYQQ